VLDCKTVTTWALVHTIVNGDSSIDRRTDGRKRQKNNITTRDKNTIVVVLTAQFVHTQRERERDTAPTDSKKLQFYEVAGGTDMEVYVVTWL